MEGTYAAIIGMIVVVTLLCGVKECEYRNNGCVRLSTKCIRQRKMLSSEDSARRATFVGTLDDVSSLPFEVLVIIKLVQRFVSLLL